VLAGEGAVLAPLAAEVLAERFRGEGQTVEVRRLSPADVEADSPVPEFRSPSFFARWRIFLLPDVSELKKGRQREIEEYLAAPEPSAVLVMAAADRAAARGLAAAAGVRLVALREEETMQLLAAHAVKVARTAGAAMDVEAGLFLARWVAGDPLRLTEEARKLAAAAGPGGQIDEERIRGLCAGAGGADPFALAEALVRGDAGRCLALFRAFAQGAQDADYHALLGAVAWTARRAVASPGRVLAPGRAAVLFEALGRLDQGLKGDSGLRPEQLFETTLLRLLG